MGFLLSLDDVRAEGLTSSTASDDRVLAGIRKASDAIHGWTRTRFEPVYYSEAEPLRINGEGLEVVHLPLPVLRLDGLSEFGSDISLDGVQVFNRRFPDDRFNPKLARKPISSTRYGGLGIWTGTEIMRAPQMRASPLNLALWGWFGFIDGTWRAEWDTNTAYVEDDAVIYQGVPYLAIAPSTGATPSLLANIDKWRARWTVPARIREAALRLIVQHGWWRTLSDPMEPMERQTGRITSESTDGHSYSLTGVITSAWPTGDPLIDDAIGPYRRLYGGSTRTATT